MKLVSMMDFVLEQKIIKQSPSKFKEAIIKYLNFLGQPIKIGMFVPCDIWGKIIESPYDYEGQSSDEWELEYEEAKDRVLFKDFKITQNDSKSHPQVIHFQNLNIFWFLSETNSWYISHGLNTVKDLSNYKLELSNLISF